MVHCLKAVSCLEMVTLGWLIKIPPQKGCVLLKPVLCRSHRHNPLPYPVSIQAGETGTWRLSVRAASLSSCLPQTVSTGIFHIIYLQTQPLQFLNQQERGLNQSHVGIRLSLAIFVQDSKSPDGQVDLGPAVHHGALLACSS